MEPVAASDEQPLRACGTLLKGNERHYGEVLENEITPYMPYEGSRMKPTKDFDYAAYFRSHLGSIQSSEKVEGFDAELYGFPDGVDRDEPTPYHVAVAARPAINLKRLGNEHNALGRLEAYFPADWPQGNYTTCLTLLLRLAEIGQPIHGTFGLGLIMEEGCGRGPFMPLAYPFLKRFIGMEYPDLGLWATMSEDAKTPIIRALNWLSLIDARRADSLGGGQDRSRVGAVLHGPFLCRLRHHPGRRGTEAGRRQQGGAISAVSGRRARSHLFCSKTLGDGASLSVSHRLLTIGRRPCDGCAALAEVVPQSGGPGLRPRPRR